MLLDYKEATTRIWREHVSDFLQAIIERGCKGGIKALILVVSHSIYTQKKQLGPKIVKLSLQTPLKTAQSLAGRFYQGDWDLR